MEAFKSTNSFCGETRGRSVNQVDGFVEITFPIIRPTETEWKPLRDGKGRQRCTLDVGAAYRKMPRPKHIISFGNVALQSVKAAPALTAP